MHRRCIGVLAVEAVMCACRGRREEGRGAVEECAHMVRCPTLVLAADAKGFVPLLVAVMSLERALPPRPQLLLNKCACPCCVFKRFFEPHLRVKFSKTSFCSAGLSVSVPSATSSATAAKHSACAPTPLSSLPLHRGSCTRSEKHAHPNITVQRVRRLGA